MSTLRWGVGSLMTLIGAMMLIAPHQFNSAVYSALHALLLWWGAAFLLIGVSLLALNVLKPARAFYVTIQLLSGSALMFLAWGFVDEVGALTAVAGWTLGTGMWIATLVEGPGGKADVDAFPVLLGAASALSGLSMVAAPAQFGSPMYDLVRPQLGILGVAFTLTGVGLMTVRLRRATHTALRVAAHLAAGGTLLVFFAVWAVPLHAWMGGAYFGGFGVALVVMPWLEHRLSDLDATSLRARLALGLALTAAIPLVVAISMVDEAVIGHSQIDPAIAAARDISFYVLLSLMAISLLVGVLVARWLTEPIGAVAKAAVRLASGDASAPLPKSAVPEVIQLAVAFADMRERLVAQANEREALIWEIQAKNERLQVQAKEIQSQNAELQNTNIELALARTAAEDAVRARDEFVSVAAHELKTPVTAMRGLSQVLMRHMEKNEGIDPLRVRPALATIDRQSRRLSDLVARLLDLSRIEGGRLTLNKEMAEVSTVVDGVAASHRHLYPEREFAVSLEGRTMAMVDCLRLEQVLTNLLDNAVKYSESVATVEIGVQRREGKVLLAVRDHGPGIAADKVARIFDRFYQAHDGQWRGGLGLGLYVSRQIVEMHGGHIEVEFPPDGGTRFVVTLPDGLADSEVAIV